MPTFTQRVIRERKLILNRVLKSAAGNSFLQKPLLFLTYCLLEEMFLVKNK
jgi:hypothetical protein